MRVNIETSVAMVWEEWAWVVPPWPAYSPSLFSRMITQFREVGGQLERGEVMPRRMRVGRTLTYWFRELRIGRMRPQREMWSGTSVNQTQGFGISQAIQQPQNK